MCSFGVFLASVLVAVHTVNNLDLGDKQSPEMMAIEVDTKTKLLLRILYQELRYITLAKPSNFHYEMAFQCWLWVSK